MLKLLKWNISENIDMSKSVPESILHDGIAVANETISSNCLNAEKDESLHQSPIFNSTDSLVGTKSLADTSNIRQQKYSSNTCQSQAALARDAVENKKSRINSTYVFFYCTK